MPTTPPTARKQFGIRHLLLSTAMIATAFCIFLAPARLAGYLNTYGTFYGPVRVLFFISCVLWFTAGPLLLAGIFMPFRKAALGAVLGGVLQLAGTCIVAIPLTGQ